MEALQKPREILFESAWVSKIERWGGNCLERIGHAALIALNKAGTAVEVGAAYWLNETG